MSEEIKFDTKLKKCWQSFTEYIENKFNVNCSPFGDIQPGNLYHLTIVNDFQKLSLGETPFAGNVTNVLIETDKVPKIKLTRALGYTYATKLVASYERPDLSEGPTPIHMLTPIFEEIRLTIEDAVGFSCKEKSYGQYLKVSELKYVEHLAAYCFTVEFNAIPMIQVAKKQ